MEQFSQLYEQAKPLEDRIAIQQAYGTRDLTEWFLDLAKPQLSETVLDIGCGNGHQLFGVVTKCRSGLGIDLSEALLDTARQAAAARGLTNVRFLKASGDQVELGLERFDLILCNFAIYYMDVARVVAKMRQHLSPTGRVYIMGSPDENARELLEIHRRATPFLPSVYAPGFSDIRKYEPLLRQTFGACTFHQFINPLRFPSPEVFVAYYTSTTLFQSSQAAVEGLEAKIREISRAWWQEKQEIRITKIVDIAELGRPRS